MTLTSPASASLPPLLSSQLTWGVILHKAWLLHAHILHLWRLHFFPQFSITSHFPQSSWCLNSDAITKKVGNKRSLHGSQGALPLCFDNHRKQKNYFHLCWCLASSAFATDSGLCRSDQCCSRAEGSSLGENTYLLFVMYGTSLMEAENIQHTLPDVQ